MDLTEKVREYIKSEQLITAGDAITLGVSGGADSVCLFRVLLSLSKELPLKLRVIYVDHGIRGEESVLDGEFVRALCDKFSVDFTAKPVDAPAFAKAEGLSLEEAARILRYEALFSDEPDIVAVAHNACDNAETIIYRLARGTGANGLSGMKPKRTHGDGVIIRPLLAVSRSEIEDYLAEINQDFVTDSTNGDDIYARNRIRHNIIPELIAINSEAVRHINEAASDIARLVYREEDRIRGDLKNMADASGLSREAVLSLPANERSETVRRWLVEELGGTDISRVHINAVMKLLFAKTGKEVSLPYGATVAVSYDRLVVKRERRSGVERKPDEVRLPMESLSVGESIDLTAMGKTFYISLDEPDGSNLPTDNYAKWFDYDKIENDMVLRTRQKGDYIVIDRTGGRKKFKDYCIDEKIPRDDRDEIPLLCAGNEVLWAIGYRRGESAIIDNTTQRVLKIELIEEG